MTRVSDGNRVALTVGNWIAIVSIVTSAVLIVVTALWGFSLEVKSDISAMRTEMKTLKERIDWLQQRID